MQRTLYLAATIVASGLMFGCNNNKTNTSTGMSPSSAAPSVTKTETPNYASAMAEEADKEAIAHIYGAGDTHDKIHGMATFTAAAPKGVKVVVDVDGLTPGKHGIHIHEKADLTDPKLMSVGGHFNPDGAEHHHAGTDDPKRHAGDLGNITVNDKGHGHLELTTDALSIEGKTGVVGHSIIIHEKEDDLKTQQPPGNAGGRVAGGAIIMATQGQKS
jgi:Cu-Zn family superoxide dismutase